MVSRCERRKSDCTVRCIASSFCAPFVKLIKFIDDGHDHRSHVFVVGHHGGDPPLAGHRAGVVGLMEEPSQHRILMRGGAAGDVADELPTASGGCSAPTRHHVAARNLKHRAHLARDLVKCRMSRCHSRFDARSVLPREMPCHAEEALASRRRADVSEWWVKSEAVCGWKVHRRRQRCRRRWRGRGRSTHEAPPSLACPLPYLPGACGFRGKPAHPVAVAR
jgi:hypothetical protein